jgi:flavin reductase (DIM6/NTAB) family NADH-FMN oxidoreductase RutF
MAAAVDLCGVKSGRDVDKFAVSRLTPAAASRIAAPLVAEAPVSLECRVTDVRPLGSHDLFLAEILAVQVSEAAIHPRSGAFDPSLTEPLCYCHGRYYGLGPELGRFGFSVEKPGTKKRRLAERNRKRAAHG